MSEDLRNDPVLGKYATDDWPESQQGDEYTPRPDPPPYRNGTHKKPPQPEGDPEPPPEVETFTAAQLMTMELPDLKWAVPDILPEGFALLAGKPKIGKSWLALNLAVAVATGGVALGSIPVEQGDVLYLALEDNKRRLKKRLGLLLGKQNTEVPEALTLATEWPRQHEGGLDAIAEWAAKVKKPLLVFIDVWTKFRPPKLRGADLYEEDYRHGEALKRMADEAGVNCSALTHCRKMPATDPMDEISGTLGISGPADAVLVMRRQRGQMDASLFVTGRDIEEEKEMALSWSAAHALWSVVGDAQACRLSKERTAIINLLRSTGKPMTPSEIAVALNKNRNTIKNLTWKMAEDGLLRTPGTGVYALKEDISSS